MPACLCTNHWCYINTSSLREQPHDSQLVDFEELLLLPVGQTNADNGSQLCCSASISSFSYPASTVVLSLVALERQFRAANRLPGIVSCAGHLTNTQCFVVLCVRMPWNVKETSHGALINCLRSVSQACTWHDILSAVMELVAMGARAASHLVSTTSCQTCSSTAVRLWQELCLLSSLKSRR